jgi:peptidyl-prolyl cis-trans isomerase C
MASSVHRHVHDADDAPRTFGQPPPCLLFVGDTAISEAEIAREMQHHRTAKPEASRAAAARALVVRELLRREIERLGLAEELAAGGQESPEEAGIRLLLEREIVDRTPTEDDCRRYYEQNRDRFRSPDRARVRHILLAAPADDVQGRWQARHDAEAIIAQLQDHPEVFADFALRRSDCPSKSEAGELGWLQPGETTPEFDRQIFRLPVGLAAFPVESRWGYHVVCVDEIESGMPLAFDAVRERIADYLELQLRQRELQHYLLTLQERYDVRGLAEIEALADGQGGVP